jgi:hypothetical protein
MKVGADPPHDLHNVIDAIVRINPKPKYLQSAKSKRFGADIPWTVK